MRGTRFVALLAVGGLLWGASCGDDDDRAVPPTAIESTTDAPSATQPSDPLLVETDLGSVRGTRSDVEGVRVFRGIPYAAPPTGELRWRPPQPRDPYPGTLDATGDGVSCPQAVSELAILQRPADDEDCLTVSVWAPEEAGGLPVLFFIHGGALREGSADEPLLTGDLLAGRGLVVVAVNFRQGPLGFLATQELADERDDGAVGSYGFLDTRAALQWTQRNIAAFGGDPGRVTIAGQSSGASLACAHLAAAGSQGLFARAIVQSAPHGARGGCDRWQGMASAFAEGQAYMAQVGCPDMACLRTRPTEELTELELNTALVEDGVTLPGTAEQQDGSGHRIGVPVIVGSTGTDAALLVALRYGEITDDDLSNVFADLTERPEELLALYPATGGATATDRFIAAYTDVVFACPTLELAARLATDAFVYHYTYNPPKDPFGFGPTHGADLIPLFGHPEGLGLEPGFAEPNMARLSAQVQQAWAEFVTSGDPGDSWEPYAEGGQVTILDDPVELVDEIRDGRCDRVSELTPFEHVRPRRPSG